MINTGSGFNFKLNFCWKHIFKQQNNLSFDWLFNFAFGVYPWKFFRCSFHGKLAKLVLLLIDISKWIIDLVFLPQERLRIINYVIFVVLYPFCFIRKRMLTIEIKEQYLIDDENMSLNRYHCHEVESSFFYKGLELICSLMTSNVFGNMFLLCDEKYNEI